VYSRTDRMKAIELYIKYYRSAATVINELGYPSRGMMRNWYKQHLLEQKTGIIHDHYLRAPKYTAEQQRVAINHYLENGKNFAQTIRDLGYPNRETLQKWRDELFPEQRKIRGSVVQFTREQKKDAVIALCSRRGSAQTVAETTGATRSILYRWKHKLLGKEYVRAMPDKVEQELPNDKDQLISEIELLKDQVRRLKLERDILEAAAELIKKDPGVDLTDLSNKEKMMLIAALSTNYPLKDLIISLEMPRSSYYYQRRTVKRENKYEQLKTHIVRLFRSNNSCYGYRRIHRLLGQEGKRVSEKVVRNVMAKLALSS